MDTMIYNGKEYQLAKNTMKIARLIDKAEKSASIAEAYGNELEFVKAAAGEGVAKEIFGTLSIEEIDLTELVLVYNAATAGYEARIEAARKERELEQVDTPAVKAIRGVADDVRAITAKTAGR